MKELKIDENGRECFSCEEYKTWDKYHKAKSKRLGHTATCKVCLRKGTQGLCVERNTGLKSAYVKDFLIHRFHLKKSEAA